MVCKIKVSRDTLNDRSITGELRVNGVKIGYTLELPDRDNQKNVSCIPAGEYDAFIRSADTSRWNYDVIELRGVPDRSYIQFHRGNFPNDTRGCILPGVTRGVDRVGSSRQAMERLMESATSSSGSIRVTVEDNF